MPCGIAHVFQIIVFAARPNTALGGHRTVVRSLVLTQKNVFELHHTRVGKQQSGVIMWNQRAARDSFVTASHKIIQEFLPNSTGFHAFISTSESSRANVA